MKRDSIYRYIHKTVIYIKQERETEREILSGKAEGGGCKVCNIQSGWGGAAKSPLFPSGLGIRLHGIDGGVWRDRSCT